MHICTVSRKPLIFPRILHSFETDTRNVNKTISSKYLMIGIADVSTKNTQHGNIEDERALMTSK